MYPGRNIKCTISIGQGILRGVWWIFTTLTERVSPRAIRCDQFLKLDEAQLLSITRQASQYKREWNVHVSN